MKEGGDLLILGLGNVLCGDDGLGVAAVARLERRFAVPPAARVVDGGTLGMALLGAFDGVRDAILVDAVGAPGSPGTLVRLAGDAVRTAARERLSVHQVGVADLLEALDWLGNRPERLVLLGLVPKSIELGLGRSPEVEAGLDALVDAVAAEATALGHPFVPREEAHVPAARLPAPPAAVAAVLGL